MGESFEYDVFLSYSSEDKAVVLAVAERLRQDGLKVWFDEWVLKPGDSIPAKIEDGLERSRVLVLCMSANAVGSDWAQLEAGTFRFRDPLNKERCFIPLRLDDAPIKGSLTQFLHINWGPSDREQEYLKLLEACRPPAKLSSEEAKAALDHVTVIVVKLDIEREIRACVFSPDGKHALSGSGNEPLRLWDLNTGRCERVLDGLADCECLAWNADEQLALCRSSGNTFCLWDVETGAAIRNFSGHTGDVWDMKFSADQCLVLSSSFDKTLRLWDVKTGKCLRVFEGHTERVRGVAWSNGNGLAVSGADDNTLRLWDIQTGKCLRKFEGHNYWVLSVALSPNERFILSGSCDKTMCLWDVESGKCLRIFEGHTSNVEYIAWSGDQRYALSGSPDCTVRLWDIETGRCLCVLEGHTTHVRSVAWSEDQRHAFSCDFSGGIWVWDLSDFITKARKVSLSGRASIRVTAHGTLSSPDQVQYTNAKLLLVGDTSAGKTGLAHRLATGQWKPSDGSTVGAWSTQWQLADKPETADLEREIWLWDFGGQADQRLVHQLFMDRAALILLLFDADKEDVLPGLREWQTALRRGVSSETPQLLVAGRTDAGFKASRAKLQGFADENCLGYYETSAKEGTGCEDLILAIRKGILWGQMEKRTSPRIFKLIKDQILKLRDDGQVLHTFKELREELWRRLTGEPRFSDEILKTVIGLLDGPGVVKELDYGTYILLQPEWINVYAQAVIRTLRQDPSELGCLPLRSISEGKLLFQTVGHDGGIVEMKRLPEAEERVVLREMEWQLEERGLCLRQRDKLVFPSHCGRDRPAAKEYPSVFVSYRVKGYLDDIYATLAVNLADCRSFILNQLWRNAADFKTLVGDHHMGIKLTREAGDSGDISVYFASGVTKQEQVIFANYIHGHLVGHCEQVQRLRYYVCPHCHTPKGNPEVLMKKLLAKKTEATVECDKCEERFGLWDDLEKLFASDDVRKKVEGLQAVDAVRLDSRRKGKLLALEVGSRITSADQKCFEIPATEDEGIDMELEFTTDEGKGAGKRLYLQLKSGNSHLKKLKDGTEIFRIKKKAWVQQWIQQPHPVMLVIGTFREEDERSVGMEKVEFAAVRWMEISSVLRRESHNGTKPVKQIVFKGERLDMTSVRKWRDKILRAE